MIRKLIAGSVLALSLAAPLAAQEAGHPLDGLTSAEHTRIIEILKADGKIGEATRLPLVALIEPDKAAVKAWKPGDALPRLASVVVKEGARSYEAVVDVSSGKVERWAEASGEAMVLFEEFLGAMELALGAPEMVEGLKARGLTPDDVFCLPLTAGAFGAETEKGRRLMKVPCYVNPTGSNFYAKPIEGLFATVDLNNKDVLEVTDTGAVPIPQDAWGYTADELTARLGGLRPAGKPQGVSAPEGANYTIDGSQIAWDMWRFRYRTDKRPGVVLSLVEARDGDRWRSVLYQAHLSEVFVPYMDPDKGWYWRTYMDSGEYGFGIFMSPLTPGVDCPNHATFLAITLSDDSGNPFEVPGAMCVFERAIGDPAWRHFEIFAQSETSQVPAEGRPATELVVRSASEVGNYDYLIDYVFQQDGTIRIGIGSTGLDAVKGVQSKSMKDQTAAQDSRYGTLIAPNLVAPNHDHYFNFRLDFDIDGEANDFMKSKLVPTATSDGLPRRSLWVVEHELPKTEKAARSQINPATPAMYHFINNNVESALGHNPSYMLKADGSYAYSQLMPSDPPAMRNAYIENQFWVTPYNAGEHYAGGSYVFQSDGSDTLKSWTDQDRAIDNRDIVAWYTVGFHHVPRMEDWPVMPIHWSVFRLMPFNFFGHNPAMSIPAVR